MIIRLFVWRYPNSPSLRSSLFNLGSIISSIITFTYPSIGLSKPQTRPKHSRNSLNWKQLCAYIFMVSIWPSIGVASFEMYTYIVMWQRHVKVSSAYNQWDNFQNRLNKVWIALNVFTNFPNIAYICSEFTCNWLDWIKNVFDIRFEWEINEITFKPPLSGNNTELF